MTRTNTTKSRTRLIYFLFIIGLLCMSLFLFTACNNDDEELTEDTTTYTYSEEDTSPISNTSFVLGTANTDYSSFPKSSVTGWSKKSDNGMSSSSAKSGVIDTSSDAWDELLNTLYNDSYFLNFFKVKYDFDDVTDKIRAEKGNSEYAPTTDEIKEYIIKNYFKSENTFSYPNGTTAKNEFKNPGTYNGAPDTKVYMLNNYLAKSKVGLGTAQSITSASTITMDKGEYGKVTVWVNTQNVSGLYDDGNADNGKDYGANVRLKNTFQGSEQADFGIFNINTNGEWKQYTLYVKSDDIYGCTFSVVLGLGYDNLSATEGTVYFDDIKYTTLTEEQFKAETIVENNSIFTAKTTKYLECNGNDSYIVTNSDKALYEMSLDNQIENLNYFNQLTLTPDIDYTKSNKTERIPNPDNLDETIEVAVTGKRFSDSKFETSSENGILTLKLTKASVTLVLGSKTDTFTLPAKSYAYVNFYIKNQLSEFGSTTIVGDIYDVYNGVSKKRAAVTTVSEISEDFKKVGIIINNNYDYDREFYLSLIIGPSDVAATDYVMDYASGTIEIAAPTIATGLIDEDSYTTTEEKAEYKLYSFFKNNADGTTSLYAGSASDYAEEKEETTTYNLTVAPSDKGTIESAPAIPSGYQGIVANHFYIKDDTEGVERDINTSDTAGLINTKYLSEYAMLPDLDAKLNHTGTKDIQPLVIYNDGVKHTHYGYVGATKNIAASAYAKVSVKLRVVDNAIAYIYLVDTASANKNVMKFNDFVAENGTEYKANDLTLDFKVTKDMMDSDGWTTVEFFVATGASAKDFRVEIWNGGRDGLDATKSAGYVFVSDITVTTSGAFTEPTKWSEAFTVTGNPLYDAGVGSFNNDQLIIYKRALTDIEKQFNEEQTDSSKIISYVSNYVWAKNDKVVYAIYNTIDAVEVDPYANESEDETEESGCTAQTDPSSFWLSFSSIILGVVLVLAILMLFIKNYRRRRKANASDAKSHFTVTSRTRNVKSAKAQNKEEPPVEEPEEIFEEAFEDDNAEVSEETQETEQTLDDYVYGNVQDFGETETNADTTELKDEEQPNE